MWGSRSHITTVRRRTTHDQVRCCIRGAEGRASRIACILILARESAVTRCMHPPARTLTLLLLRAALRFSQAATSSGCAVCWHIEEGLDVDLNQRATQGAVGGDLQDPADQCVVQVVGVSHTQHCVCCVCAAIRLTHLGPRASAALTRARAVLPFPADPTFIQNVSPWLQASSVCLPDHCSRPPTYQTATASVSNAAMMPPTAPCHPQRQAPRAGPQQTPSRESLVGGQRTPLGQPQQSRRPRCPGWTAHSAHVL